MNVLNLWLGFGIVVLGLVNFSISKQQGKKMQFSQVGNIEKIKKSKQYSQDEAERTRKGRKDNKRKRGKDRSWMEEPKAQSLKP